MKLIYPPRPENCIPVFFLKEYESFMYFTQPKLDGSNGLLYIDSNNSIMYNRHKEIMLNVKADVSNLYRKNKGRIVLNGEYLNKNKKHINIANFNHKFVIFDILEYNGKSLLGTTYKERQLLLDSLYGTGEFFDGFIRKIDTDIFRVSNFENVDITKLYTDLTKIELYEGVVIKSNIWKLESGSNQGNNNKSMVKCRRQTKNYSF